MRGILRQPCRGRVLLPLVSLDLARGRGLRRAYRAPESRRAIHEIERGEASGVMAFAVTGRRAHRRLVQCIARTRLGVAAA